MQLAGNTQCAVERKKRCPFGAELHQTCNLMLVEFVVAIEIAVIEELNQIRQSNYFNLSRRRKKTYPIPVKTNECIPSLDSQNYLNIHGISCEPTSVTPRVIKIEVKE